MSKSDGIDKALIGEAGGLPLQYIQVCMVQNCIFANQKSLNSFKDSPTYTAAGPLVNVTNTGRTRAFSASEAGMIVRLLRANSSAAVELGVVITYTYPSRN